jgi:hypothetical protein
MKGKKKKNTSEFAIYNQQSVAQKTVRNVTKSSLEIFRQIAGITIEGCLLKNRRTRPQNPKKLFRKISEILPAKVWQNCHDIFDNSKISSKICS